MLSLITRIMLAFSLMFIFTPSAHAGGGPENVMVVVNSDSWMSLSVANHFVRLRSIPASNVVHLSDIPDFERISVDQFRAQILRPVLKAIESRGLGQQIDYAVYSCDFPWAVDIREDVKGVKLPQVITPVAAINGLTYLYESTLSGKPNYLGLNANFYVRKPVERGSQLKLTQATLGQLRQAMQLFGAKKWNEAEPELRKLMETFPDNQALAVNLSICLVNLDRHDDAIEMLGRAVDAGWAQRRKIESDANFKPVREREDFKQLLTEMEQKVVGMQATLAFRNEYQFQQNGEQVIAGGQRYMLSTVLGVSSGRGNSLDEIRECLSRSVAADGSRPKGKIYFPVNANVRSRTRDGLYRSAAKHLDAMGVAAEITQGTVPTKKDDVAGVMMGTAAFDWPKSQSRILPGAICEHLTSFGGVMKAGAGQTPLSEYIRHGAAGSSGTVTEPYALQQKFPLPFMHVHYAAGASLAEAYYQSVAGPYQLLIVGDPLCQPWAVPPKFQLEGLEDGQRVTETISVNSKPAEDSVDVAEIRWFLDGKFQEVTTVDGPFELDHSKLAPGFHELRAVATADTEIESQSRQVIEFESVVEDVPAVQVALDEPHVALSAEIRVELQASGAQKIELFCQHRLVGSVDGAKGTVAFPANTLGLGGNRLAARATLGDDIVVLGKPVDVAVVPDQAAAPSKAGSVSTDFVVQWDDNTKSTISSTESSDWLAQHKKATGTKFTIVTSVKANEDATHQLQLKPGMPVQVEIAGKTVDALPGKWTYIPVTLRSGRHELKLHGKLDEKPKLDIRFGNRGTRRIPPSDR
jgi:hypothetical protein